MTNALFRLFAVSSALAILAACEVGPDYKRPEAPVPAAYKEQGDWQPSQPKDAASDISWWSVYRDQKLDALEGQIDISNQTLKAAEAAYRQATAIVEQGRAGYYPTLALDGSGIRSGQGSGSGGARGKGVQNQFSLSAGASWEPDIWGRISRTVEGDIASAQASEADLAAARLSAQATLATDYLELRMSDELKRLLDATVEDDAISLTITQNRYRAGTAAKSDVAQAQAQLDATRAQAINVGVQRAQLEHAIAVLTGKPPADFSIPPEKLTETVPDIPPEMPSTLLERRPDIAASERQMAAANAQIGVAVSAYYPNITLNGSYGFTSAAIDTLIRASNAVWSFGPQIAETVFDAGLRQAQVAAARAAYDQSVATYRQTVLAGFQQVEDELAALGILAQQAEVQDSAVKSAAEAEKLILNEYKAGTVDYTSVITAQQAKLADEQGALTILQNRLVASVTLIEALGGGWDAAQLDPDKPEKAAQH